MATANKQKGISERFDRMYKSNTTPWKSHGPKPLLDEFANKLGKDKPNAKLLDLGCGDGWISIAFAKSGFSVWGIDSSETAIKKAKSVAEEEGVGVNFKVGNALDLPYDENFFDAIADRGLLHHILPKNRDEYFKNILKVLKDNAYMYLSTFSMKNPEGIGQRFTIDLVKELFGNNFEVLKKATDPWPTDNPAHLHHFILKRIK